MAIEISDALERMLEEKALAMGVPAAACAVQLLERDLGNGGDGEPKLRRLKTSYDAAAMFSPARSDKEIDENGREMLRHFGESF